MPWDFDPDDTGSDLPDLDDDSDAVPSWWRDLDGNLLCAHHACLFDLENDGFFCEPLSDDEIDALDDDGCLGCAECGDPLPLSTLTFPEAA